MVAHGLTPEKFFYIPNGVVIEEWDESESLPSEHLLAINEIKRSYEFTIAYAGTHGLANALDTLIDAAKFLRKEIAVVLVGDGIEKDRLQKKARGENVNNVFFLPPVPKKKVPALLRQFDAFYIGLQRQSLFRFGISPNKMFDYMMAGKPIIQAIEAGNNMVEEHSCGLAVKPENADSVSAGINYLSSLSYEERIQLGASGKKAIFEFYDYKVLCENFIRAARETNNLRN
jgi:glycosyltransferase involved in cell wall biosynthesis